MEIRHVQETKVWKLVLNPMQSNTEAGNIVAVSFDKQKLIDWCEGEKASEPWIDVGENSFPAKGDFGGYHNEAHKWHKVFKKGSELEWYNPCSNYDGPDHFHHGLSSEWVGEVALKNIPFKMIN